MGELRRIIKALRARDVSVVVTGVPHLPQFTGKWNPRTHQTLGDLVAETGALYLNSYDAISARATTDEISALYFSSDPTHFNEAGNAVFADIQFAFLMRHAERLFGMRLERKTR